MAKEVNGNAASAGAVTEIQPGEWPEWCRRATENHAGRIILLHYSDAALGDVRLADGQPFVAIEHDKLGPSVALTIKYGDGVVPMRHVIGDPRAVRQHRDAAGEVSEVTILDATGRQTFISLA